MALAKKVSNKKIVSRPTSRSLEGGTSGWFIVAKVALTLAALAIPVLVGDWTPDRWEIHKTMALLLAVTVAWLAFFIGQFKQPAAAWHWHPVDWLVLALGVAAVVGAITGITPWVSILGLQGAYAETVPATIGFVSFYFLGARLFQQQRERFMLWAATLTGLGVALLLQLGQFSGVSLFPSSLASDPLFSTLANSSMQVALLAAAVGTIGLLLWPKVTERWAQWGIVLVVSLGWLMLFFLGQAVAWAVFALGMILVVMNQAGRPSKGSSKVVMIAVALAVMGMLTQFFTVTKYTSLPSTTELNLSQRVSAATAFSAFVHRPVLGTGSNTWFDAFVHYRPTSFNADARWSGRYLRAGMEWAQVLATQGIVGVAAWVGILLLIGWECWRRLRQEPSVSYMVGLFMAAALAMTFFLSTWSLQLLLLAWISFALVRAKIHAEAPRSATAPYVPAIGFAVVAILSVVLWYPAIRVYASQVQYTRVQNMLQDKVAVAKIVPTLKSAVALDSHNTDAGILLANAYVSMFQDDLTSNNLTAAQKDIQLAQDAIQATVTKNSTNPTLYEAQNNILNTLAAYLTNPEVQANKNFVALRDLEPASPIHDVGYGQTLLVMRARAAAATTGIVDDKKQEQYLQDAMAAFNLALKKKPDYLQARYARADAEMSAGQYQASLDDLDQLIATTPSEPIFWASKGSALGKLGQTDASTTAFEQALKLNSTDTTIYLAYSQMLVDAKKTAEAKDVLNRGIKAVPSATDLTDALKKLES